MSFCQAIRVEAIASRLEGIQGGIFRSYWGVRLVSCVLFDMNFIAFLRQHLFAA